MTRADTVAPLLAIMIAFTVPAQAASFADKFKDFVLGTQAQANVPDPSSLLDETARGCMQCHNGSA